MNKAETMEALEKKFLHPQDPNPLMDTPQNDKGFAAPSDKRLEMLINQALSKSQKPAASPKIEVKKPSGLKIIPAAESEETSGALPEDFVDLCDTVGINVNMSDDEIMEKLDEVGSKLKGTEDSVEGLNESLENQDITKEEYDTSSKVFQKQLKKLQTQLKLLERLHGYRSQ